MNEPKYSQLRGLPFFLALLFLSGALAPETSTAQVWISGYMQAEWLHFDLGNDENDRGFYSDERKNLFQIRRGRIKATHNAAEGFKAVSQIDFTEKGVSIKDAYVDVPILDSGQLNLKVGYFNKPNYEVELSSSRRESTERSQVVKNFYKGERGLGFMFTLRPIASGSFQPELQLGLFNGSGNKAEVSPYKDMTARLHLPIPTGDDSDIDLSVGALAYVGGLEQTDDTLVVFENGAQVLESREPSADWPGYGNRSHLGFELQLGLDLLSFGKTELRGEYLMGQTPSRTTRDREDMITVVEDSVQIFDTVTTSIPTLRLRNQSGFYVMFVQGLGDHLQLAAKYDVLDRNTDLAGDEVGGSSDRASSVLGLGLVATFGPIRMTGWYEMPSFAENEARFTDDLGITHVDDLKDNKATIRFQYKWK